MLERAIRTIIASRYDCRLIIGYLSIDRLVRTEPISQNNPGVFQPGTFMDNKMGCDSSPVAEYGYECITGESEKRYKGH